MRNAFIRMTNHVSQIFRTMYSRRIRNQRRLIGRQRRTLTRQRQAISRRDRIICADIEEIVGSLLDEMLKLFQEE